MHPSSERFPWSGLLALAMAGFIVILTEALPAGLLPLMSADLGVPESLVGQLVTSYALGSLVTAIPVTAATSGWRRRPLLLAVLVGFIIVNTATALSRHFVLTLVTRFVAGMFAGLLWALLAGYASRMVSEHLRGRAIAVAMVGAPIALSMGIPAGTLLGAVMGWRSTFGVMSALTVGLLVWVLGSVPDFAGQAAEARLPLRRVAATPGLKAVLFVTFSFVLAHNMLYTYIAPFLAPSGLAGRVDAVLFVFGLAGLLGIWGVGVLIDRWLRALVLGSTLLFLGAAVSLGVSGAVAVVAYVAVAVWGLAFGGAATLFQTASANTAGNASDVAQSMVVTVWGMAMAGGGLVGGVLMETLGVASLSWGVSVLLVSTFLVTWRARAHGFPAASRG
ncbi:MFS transporter [Citreicoccus inhibens]|uniref:MFS transporter n=1 Tax=Citreicoccus inhibens TaxID=2849499 RepID=UPI002AA58ECF|nr:MFS transporter [Citreicoccus inhibens]